MVRLNGCWAGQEGEKKMGDRLRGMGEEPDFQRGNGAACGGHIVHTCVRFAAKVNVWRDKGTATVQGRDEDYFLLAWNNAADAGGASPAGAPRHGPASAAAANHHPVPHASPSSAAATHTLSATVLSSANVKTEKPSPDFIFEGKQMAAIELAKSGRNIFITGVAGTGKSVVTEKIIADAKAIKKKVAVAAPTGVAALNIGGATLHSMCGISIASYVNELGSMWRFSVDVWRTMDVLVLDEVGMLQADLLDWIDVTVRSMRNEPDKAFGGIQLIFVGDFAQLGPVAGETTLSQTPAKPDSKGADLRLNIKELYGMAFQTAMWREANFTCICLTEIMRQKHDADFVLALMDIREGRTKSENVTKLVHDCNIPLENISIASSSSTPIEPTVLYAINRRVDHLNLDKLNLLPSNEVVFRAIDDVHVNQEIALEKGWEPDSPAWGEVKRRLEQNDFFESCMARAEVQFKCGAQVMLLRNLSEKEVPEKQRLVNGSRGVIVGFERTDDDELIKKWGNREWPVVEFMTLDTCNSTGKYFTRTKRIEPQTFSREVYREGTCIRSQVPLRLAWALTIHKSQGATLPLVKVDLQGCFGYGQVEILKTHLSSNTVSRNIYQTNWLTLENRQQAYVAISRACTRRGLHIVNFKPDVVKTNQTVMSFYASIDSVQSYSKFLSSTSMWWHPVLKSPRWLTLFQHAKGNGNGAAQFRHWCEKYPPPNGGAGIGGGGGKIEGNVVMKTPPPGGGERVRDFDMTSPQVKLSFQDADHMEETQETESFLEGIDALERTALATPNASPHSDLVGASNRHPDYRGNISCSSPKRTHAEGRADDEMTIGSPPKIPRHASVTVGVEGGRGGGGADGGGGDGRGGDGGGADNDEAMKVHVVGGELMGKDGGGLAHVQDSLHSHSKLNSGTTIEDGLARRFACAPVAEENEGGNEGSGGGFVTTHEQTREVEVSSEVDECQQADEMPSAAVTVAVPAENFSHAVVGPCKAHLLFRAQSSTLCQDDIPEIIALDADIRYTVGRKETEEDNKADFIYLDSAALPRMVSRRHATISFSTAEGAWLVTDLGSLNGLLLNGIKILHAALKEGDLLTFGGGKTAQLHGAPRPTARKSIYTFSFHPMH